MEMHQIRYFLSVCETLNFTRAAQLCNVSQPALTRAIQKLEEELGGQLFRRERGLTHVTELGRMMRPHLAQILQESDAALTTARSYARLDRAPLKLGLMCTIGPRHLVPFLSRLQARNPGVELMLYEARADELSAMLTQGQLEVAVLAQPAPLDPRFDAHPLYRERFTVAFPPGHRFTSLERVPLAELSGQRYLERANCEFGTYFDEICMERGIELHVSYSSEREDWIQTMILAGLGVCLLPEYSVVVDGVLTRPVDDPLVTREVMAVTVAGRRFSAPASAFLCDMKAFDWMQ